jgi:hypothetical protein
MQAKRIDRNTFSIACANLRAWQPTASHIRRSAYTCPDCHSSIYLSYLIMVCLNNPPSDKTLTNCGYYCDSCKSGKRGARKKQCR